MNAFADRENELSCLIEPTTSVALTTKTSLPEKGVSLENSILDFQGLTL